MAHSSLHGKYLVCFGCNKKSDLKYDGLIRKWECVKCDAMNFLDKNGEITDPPLATDMPAPAPTRYAITRSESSPSQNSDSSIFCALCLKNQHLYASSLAQYEMEVEPSHPDFARQNRAYYKFRKDLEKRYPQVCKVCEPAVVKRMNEASKTAKTDHLRRMMDKTRANQAKSTTNTVFTIETLGKVIWYAGVSGQLIWNLMALIAIALFNTSAEMVIAPDSPAVQIFQPVIAITTSRIWAFRTLMCSIVSVWWNPKFKESTRGFSRHISGFQNWYTINFILIAVRLIFYWIMCSNLFADPFSPVTTGAHIIMPLISILLVIKAFSSLKVDMSPLWKSGPETISYVKPRSRTSSETSDCMDGMLDQIMLEGPKRDRNQKTLISSSHITETFLKNSHRISASKPLTPDTFPSSSCQNTQFDQSIAQNRSLYADCQRQPMPATLSDTDFTSGYNCSPLQESSTYDLPGQSTPCPLDISQKEFEILLKSGIVPPRLEGNYNNSPISEEMEWSPTCSQTPAFNPRPNTYSQRFSQRSSLAPAMTRSNAIWTSVPAAPISPAHRLRNPPHRVQIHPQSQEAKQNFFENMTKERKGQTHENSLQNKSMSKGFELTQQKFFPPEPPSEAGNTLADLLTGFSLSEPDENNKILTPTSKNICTRHIIQGVALSLASLLVGGALYQKIH